ncbi:preprotein translocase subunit SecE [Weeksellaceae bacterium TAE3-ERU29]|nr:preprotein translocase subunit SecE [Weeksellaceae bacterium TAE3-ERU29]
MKGIVNFLRGSYFEFTHNVTWPKWNELQSSTIVIAISVLILAIFLFGVDTSFSHIVDWFYRALR